MTGRVNHWITIVALALSICFLGATTVAAPQDGGGGGPEVQLPCDYTTITQTLPAGTYLMACGMTEEEALALNALLASYPLFIAKWVDEELFGNAGCAPCPIAGNCNKVTWGPGAAVTTDIMGTPGEQDWCVRLHTAAWSRNMHCTSCLID